LLRQIEVLLVQHEDAKRSSKASSKAAAAQPISSGKTDRNGGARKAG